MKMLLLKYGKEYAIAMGDTIDCVSLINQIARNTPRLLLPCKHTYVENVKSFFPPDIDIQFYPLTSYDQIEVLRQTNEVLEIDGDATGIVKSLYDAAGMDYVNREKYCTINQQLKRTGQYIVPAEPYAFIPEGGSTGQFKIDRKYVSPGLKEIVPPQDAKMLSYANIIKNAAEIHCHATAFDKLIDKLPTTGKLFWHKYARITPCMPDFTKNWTIIE